MIRSRDIKDMNVAILGAELQVSEGMCLSRGIWGDCLLWCFC